jgi:hypothetical protein
MTDLLARRNLIFDLDRTLTTYNVILTLYFS